MFHSRIGTPVAFIIFKRPDTTARVFEAIRQVKPPKLLVVADGPRPDRPGEDQECAAARAIIDQVDWDCEELLERYRYDRRIMSISGQNVQFGRKRTDYSYYFSRYNHCWSWASWRRAWQHYDLDMKLWPEIRDGNFLVDVLGDSHAVKVWTNIFQLCYEVKIDTWDFQWVFASFIQNGMNILANVNLASNIGYGTGGTHTGDSSSPYNNMLAETLTFPLKHPPFAIRDTQADNFTQNTLYDYDPSLLKKVQKKIYKLLK